MNASTYVLAVGEQGKERLAILNEVYGSTSYTLLKHAGIKSGQSILEIGCGSGNMTCWLAQQVGHQGTVYAIDISDQQIALAKQQTNGQGFNNVKFINLSIYDLNTLSEQFDIVYSRFVITHLHEPLKAIEKLSQRLKPNGNLVLEEVSNAVYCCYPENPSYIRYRDLLVQLLKVKKLDPYIGEKLYSYCLAIDIKPIFAKFLQPILLTKREKRMLPLLIQEIKPMLIKNNLAFEPEIDKLIEDLLAFIEDDNYFFSMPRVTQIIGKKND